MHGFLRFYRKLWLFDAEHADVDCALVLSYPKAAGDLLDKWKFFFRNLESL